MLMANELTERIKKDGKAGLDHDGVGGGISLINIRDETRQAFRSIYSC
jgi:hypothetical protein